MSESKKREANSRERKLIWSMVKDEIGTKKLKDW